VTPLELARQVLLVLLLERRLLVVLGLFVVMLTFQFLVYAIQGLVGE
jgi:Na+-transporting methylmalonyl-CoA/oxaloacetate decarboxylase gamma subunit